jgi:hypothetical protein
MINMGNNAKISYMRCVHVRIRSKTSIKANPSVEKDKPCQILARHFREHARPRVSQSAPSPADFQVSQQGFCEHPQSRLTTQNQMRPGQNKDWQNLCNIENRANREPREPREKVISFVYFVSFAVQNRFLGILGQREG